MAAKAADNSEVETVNVIDVEDLTYIQPKPLIKGSTAFSASL